MGVRFAPDVCWRVSKRGLVIARVDDDALLLEHPQAGQLPEFLADEPSADTLACRLGEPNAETLIAEMLDAGVLSDAADAPGRPIVTSARTTARTGTRRVIVTRSGVEFLGIAGPAGWLDRRIVPLLLSWPGRIALAVLVIGGTTALLTGRPDGPTVTAHPMADALLGLAIMLVGAALHELAHAVALVHYGRRPRRAGFGFYWGGVSFYVDSTEALTLPRRARVIQALAGLAVDVGTVSVLALIAHLSTTILLTAVCWRLAIIGLTDIVTNLLPILQVDGHWALADYLDEPDLAMRARAAFGDTLRRRHNPETPRWLAAYGATSVIAGLALLGLGAVVWWAVAADLVRALFAGSIIEIAVGVVLVGPLLAGILLSSLGLILEVALATDTPVLPAREEDPEPH
jgi:hypothetical protein